MQEANRCPAYERCEECQLASEESFELEEVNPASPGMQPHHENRQRAEPPIEFADYATAVAPDLSIPVACVSWTVTHEEVFREPRDYCKHQSEQAQRFLRRKFFYLFTCEYCFSHYAAAIFLLITRFRLLYPDGRGYLVSLFALVWVSNMYMAAFVHLHLDIHHERLEIKSKDLDLKSKAEDLQSDRAA